MSVALDIVATYRRPGRVMSRILGGGPREDRALVYLMAGCAMMFIAQLPGLARQAHLDGGDLNMAMGGALMGWIFIAPLFFYVLAAVSHMVSRLLGGRGSAWSSRVALFWALLAASPLFLLLGLVLGFIGPGPQATLVGTLWVVAFFWFWISGALRAAKEVSA